MKKHIGLLVACCICCSLVLFVLFESLSTEPTTLATVQAVIMSIQTNERHNGTDFIVKAISPYETLCSFVIKNNIFTSRSILHSDGTRITPSDLQVGDLIEITCSGPPTETHPVGINAIKIVFLEHPS